VAVRIRLKRMGKVRSPHYRIVVCDSRTKRDGRVIEEIGTYNPKADPSVIHVDSDRAQHWLGVGAQPSTPVAAILRRTGDWQRFKGEPEPEPLKVAEPKRDKTEIFNEALKDAHDQPKSEAVTKKSAKPDKDKAEKKAGPSESDAATAPAETATAETAQADAGDAGTGETGTGEPGTGEAEQAKSEA
jgi:small subunit ribosomal protein S16